MQTSQLEYHAAASAIQGSRDYQEDAMRLWSPEQSDGLEGSRANLLVVLCDGMGGHVSGEIASSLVCERSVRFLASNWKATADQIGSVLNVANEALEYAVQADARLKGMGCTAIVALADNSGLRWASVGDSSLLHYRNRVLRRLNEDHSMGALLDRQAQENIITFEEARASPHRRSLRSALTGARFTLADIQPVPLRLLPGDWIIVASDGLETLSGDDIATIIARHGERHPKALVDNLLQQVIAKNQENQDNASVIAVRVQAGHVSDATVRIVPRSGNTDDAMRATTEIVDNLGPGRVVGHALPYEQGSQTTGSVKFRVAAWIAMFVVLLGGAVAVAMFRPDLVNGLLLNANEVVKEADPGGANSTLTKPN